jgi:hypothetical protein
MAASSARGGKTSPAQPPENDGILRIGESAEEPKYDVLFKIDGKPYKGLMNPPGSVLHKYILTIRRSGPNAALSWLYERMLAPDAHAALMDSEKVSDTDFDEITKLCIGLINGRPVAPKAKT